ncbi:MAG: NAD-dependent epimerase/dehydratase family protein, partial [Gemmatimonadetes bacterium]|nr:NAD-dependent epimerase/dehydratase family protein [Gemmatimonadota bacterium]
MARYLVTGGAGFIGSHLCARLVADGHDVRALDDLSSGHRSNLDGVDVDLIVGDLRDSDALGSAVEGADFVLHHAAIASVQYSVEHPLEEQDVNVVGTLQVLEAARAAGVRRVVFAASAAAYGADEKVPKQETMPTVPISPYGLSKVAGEHYCRVWSHVYELETVCLRYFNIFGPRQDPASPYSGVISIFARAMIDGRTPTIHGDGEQSRDFTFVDNVVAANMLACAMPSTAGEIYNIGGNNELSNLAVARKIIDVLGMSERAESLITFVEDRHFNDLRYTIDSSKLQALGWVERTSWEEG